MFIVMYLTGSYCKFIKMSTPSSSSTSPEEGTVIEEHEQEIKRIVSKFSHLETVIFQLPLNSDHISYSEQTYPNEYPLKVSEENKFHMRTIPFQFDKSENHAFPAKDLWRNNEMKVNEIMSEKKEDDENQESLSDVCYVALKEEKTIKNFDILPGDLFFDEQNYYIKSNENMGSLCLIFWKNWAN
jgi:hypothetical protein